jgi:hypothetical protein
MMVTSSPAGKTWAYFHPREYPAGFLILSFARIECGRHSDVAEEISIKGDLFCPRANQGTMSNSVPNAEHF